MERLSRWGQSLFPHTAVTAAAAAGQIPWLLAVTVNATIVVIRALWEGARPVTVKLGALLATRLEQTLEQRPPTRKSRSGS